MQRGFLLALFVLSFVGVGPHAGAADWPMWRFDGQRSGLSPEALPEGIQLQWTRELGPVRPAWPNEDRLHFDASYEPIVLGSRLFLGSPNDGTLTAYDTRTGEEIWRYHTDGPVRLAPLAWKGRVFFGSDDGHLYCVRAESGVLLWKVRGATDDRPDHRHLGNGRLVSYWPVRGGPVLADDVVYFGAGIWPSLGVFVRAVHARTGEVLWTNSNSHAIANVRIDHNYMNEAGISPQGHMAIAGDLLIVPNGRSMPARIDRKTGKMLYFVQGYRNGDSRVVIFGDVALVGERGVVSLKDGREIGSRWAQAGKGAPEGFVAAKKDQFEGPYHPYHFLPGCDFRAVLDNGIAYGLQAGTLYAYDVRHAKTTTYDKEDNGHQLKPARWDAPLLWKLSVGKPGSASKTLIKAGRRLYGHVGTQLLAVELTGDPKQPAKQVWAIELESEPTSLLAAADRLFVVTADGRLHCFGADALAPRTHRREAQALRNRSDRWTKTTPALLEAARTDAGYALVLGLEEGGLVEELLRTSGMNVIAIDERAQKINTLRRRLTSEGEYDTRFQGIVADPTRATLPHYIAHLITSERPQSLNLTDAAALKRVFKSLRPYGGTAAFVLDDAQRQAVSQTAKASGLPGAESGTTSELALVRRVGALQGAADWTHETGDAARTFYSRDALVQAPLGILWYGDGPDHGFYKRKDYGHGVKPQVAGGKLIALQIASRTLHAVDAYTGRLLWIRKVGPSTRYAAMADAIYVASGRTCDVLNPETGRPLTTLSIDVGQPADAPVSVSDIRVGEQTILLAFRFNREDSIPKGRWNSQLLVALDRVSGEQLWSARAKQRFNTAAIALAGGRVYCIDSHSPIVVADMRRRGEPVGRLPSTIQALDARSGKMLWQAVRDDPPPKFSTLHFIGMRSQDDWLAYSTDHDLVLAGKGDNTHALSGKEGKQVWHKPIRGNQPLILGPETFINQSGHTYAVADGRLIDGNRLFQRVGCNYAVGGKNLLFLRDACAAYVDIKSRTQYDLRNLRSGCSNSLVAADGLLNVPCFSVGCVCNYPIQTSFAMHHMPQVADWHGLTPRMQKTDKPQTAEAP